MKSLQTALDEYLAIRRALGYKLSMPGRLLQKFVEFAKQAGAAYITTELAMKSATQPAHAQTNRWSSRLGVVRRFAQYFSPSDPRIPVPPPDLLPYPFLPFRRIFFGTRRCKIDRSGAAIALRKRAASSHLRHSLWFYAATGMRTSEALRLDRDDVDFGNGVVTIRDTKFGKSRAIPVHPSTRGALQRYARDETVCSAIRKNRASIFRITALVSGTKSCRPASACLATSVCVTMVTPADLVSSICVIASPFRR